MKIFIHSFKGFFSEKLYNNIMNGPEAYTLAKENPTKENRQLFIFAHLNYIRTCANRVAHIFNNDDADDFVSDVYLNLLRYSHNLNFRKSYDELKGYLSMAVKNNYKAMLILKKYKNPRQCITGLDDWQFEKIIAESEDEKPENFIKLEKIISLAKPKEKEIIDYLIEGKSFKEIAKIKGCSHQWLRQMMYRFGRRIKGVLKEF